MRVKTILLLAVAVGCGLVAMLGVQQAMKGGGAPEEEKVTVLVATSDISVGTEITPELVAFRKMAIANVPETAIVKEEQYQKRAAIVPLFANDMITTNKLGEVGAIGTAITIPKGMRVVSVPVNDTQTHSGMLSPGDRVDVSVTYQIRTARGQTTKTKTLLEYISVFATGSKTASDTTSDNEAKVKNISVLVTPEQANYLNLALKKGTLALVWRHPADDEHVAAQSVDEALLEELAGTVDRDARDYPSYEGEGFGDEDETLVATTGTSNDISLFLEQQARAEEEARLAREAAAAASAAAMNMPTDPTKPLWKMEIFSGERREIIELEFAGEEHVSDAEVNPTEAVNTVAPGMEALPTPSSQQDPATAKSPWNSLWKQWSLQPAS